MKIESGINMVAGIMVLVSVLLTQLVHPNFVWLTVFIGFNLFQSAFTHFCPAAIVLKKIGLK